MCSPFRLSYRSEVEPCPSSAEPNRSAAKPGTRRALGPRVCGHALVAGGKAVSAASAARRAPLLALLVLVATWGASSTTAFAFPDEPASLNENGLARKGTFQLLGDFALYVGGPQADTDLWSLSPLFDLRVLITRSFALQAQWGLALASTEQRGDRNTGVRPGNPLFAAHYLGKKNGYSYRVGAGITAPIATVPDDANDSLAVQTAFAYAAAMRGNWDFWLWDPHAISIALPAKFERLKANGFLWGVDFGFGVLIPISDKNEELDVAIQSAAVLGYQALPWLRVGSRFHLVVLPLLEGQKTQLAAEPYARIGNDTRFVSLRMMVNIDNPYGFAFDENKVWGLRLGGGFSF